MTYIEQFLSQHIISYYLCTLRGSIGHHQFVNHQSQRNFFSLTWQILLFGENITKSEKRRWLIDLISKNLKISYDDLKDVSLPGRGDDSEAIQYIKRSFQYAYIQMHQIMVRLILAHLLTAEFDSLTTEVQVLVHEIGYIYPALKAEISINGSQINLTNWFEVYLTQLIEQKTPKLPFFSFLEKLSFQCNFIGPMERLFNKLIALKETEQLTQKEREYESSVCESRSESLSKFSQDRLLIDFELFRKTKRIAKQKFRTHNSNIGSFVTPVKIKEQYLATLAETQKTDCWGFQQNNQSSQSQSHTTSSAFSKLLKRYKKPMVRTIYHGSKKTFVPKKYIGVNDITAQQYIENLTASSSLTSNETLKSFEINRRYSTKFANSTLESQDVSQFCVPETPKQEPLRRIFTDKKIVPNESRKSLPRLKI